MCFIKYYVIVEQIRLGDAEFVGKAEAVQVRVVLVLERFRQTQNDTENNDDPYSKFHVQVCQTFEACFGVVRGETVSGYRQTCQVSAELQASAEIINDDDLNVLCQHRLSHRRAENADGINAHS